MKLFQVDTLDEARARLCAAAGSYPAGTETIPVPQSLGRVLAEDLSAGVDVPGFLRSTVDGYAVLSRDTQGAGESIPVFLKPIGEVAMGENTELTIQSGECVYVPTGAMLPAGADAVVMVEYCEPFGSDGIAVYNAVSPGRHTVERGEDMRRGTVFLRRGIEIRPQEIGAMASAGVQQVCVYRPLTVTILSTGDELADPAEPLTPGKVYDINTYSLEALAARRGFRVNGRGVVRDDRSALEQALRDGMARSDVVVISGGSSQGKKDMTSAVIDELTDHGVLTHGLAVKPGKPTILGYDGASNTILAGLPGHPVAAMLVFELILCQVMRQLTGRGPALGVYASMETNVGCDAGKANCILVELLESADGYLARPIYGKSGLITTLSRAHGYTLTDQNKEGVRQGETVFVHLL